MLGHGWRLAGGCGCGAHRAGGRAQGDLGSGGSVDMMVINKDGNTPLRNYDRPNQRRSKREYNFPRGTTTVLSKTFTPLSSLVTIETTTTASAMQVG